MPAFYGTNGVSHYYQVRAMAPVFYLESAALECYVFEDERLLRNMMATLIEIERHPP
jgi:hypothetical protein